ncbi:MAG: isovaleryl-CoA dehydrogenase [Bdellovibrionales bacterium]|nr:isovaleryl-CoA dehydrogenase [Ramlibacter sp.]
MTHEVFNQPAPLVNYNLFTSNRAMQDAVQFNAPGLDVAELAEFGALLGTSAMQTHARLANLHTPQLHTHDRSGHRIDQVEFHPSYHVLMATAVGAGLHGAPWTNGPHAHLRRAAAFMLFTELEPATLCPISMSYAVAPALQGNTAIAAQWLPLLASRQYDPELKLFSRKPGVTMGMGMTEKQGGSDVRANTTQAVFEADDAWGRRFRITGHKWFFSAPMCDAFLILAQTAAGLSCFFLPRVLPGDEALNPIRIQRLKDKLGNKANASSEVEFHSASAWLVGEEGRGIQQILEMGVMTRLDCALGTSGLMRQALCIALNHASQRSAFGKRLIEQPLMKNVLADLALESEAATALALRLAHAFDDPASTHESVMRRLLTPVSKYWICKRGSHFAQEAMECLGGNGYVEEGGEGIMARIYREMPLNSIWEGAGNIMALDLLRALRKADVGAALAQELAPARGAHPALDRLVTGLPARVEDMATEVEARRLAQDVALAVQAALLFQSAPAEVFNAFCDSRIAGNWGQAFGTLAAHTDFDAIIDRAMPTGHSHDYTSLTPASHLTPTTTPFLESTP